MAIANVLMKQTRIAVLVMLVLLEQTALQKLMNARLRHVSTEIVLISLMDIHAPVTRALLIHYVMQI